jgi:tyrosine-protein kinase Etk/Wzc
LSTNLETNTQGDLQSEQDDDVESTGLLDTLLVLLAYKKRIISVTLSAAIIFLIISLLLPKVYEGKARVMPAQNQNTSAAVMSQFSSLAGLAGISLGAQTPSDLLVGILKGDTIADAIIDRFDLLRQLDIDYRVIARKELADLVDVESDKKSGIITITVSDKVPEQAARMANAFVEELQKLMKSLAVTAAAKRRLFFEEQFKEAHNALAQTEDELKGFQESTGAIKIDEQAKALLEGIAILQAQITSKEIELRVRKTYSTVYNKDFKRAEEELNALKDELRKFDTQDGGKRSNTMITTQQIPGLGTQYLRKLREFKYQETLYEIMLKQYEMARLDEAQDDPLVQTIDSATPPDYKSKPKRAIIVILATFLAFSLSVASVFIQEAYQKACLNPEFAERFQKIKSHLKFWETHPEDPSKA